MLTGLRQSLLDLNYGTLQENSSHTGLWFHKYLRYQPVKGEKVTVSPYETFVKACCAFGEPQGYAAFFKRWQDTMLGLDVQLKRAEVRGRLAAGLGNESLIENGIMLHHTYGVPIIRGSSLKGTAAAYANEHLSSVWRKDKAAHDTLFGTQDGAGFVTFFDALPIPGSWKLHPDVITVHHPDYYQNGNKAPADWDSPTPIPFITASGDFLIALYAPDAPAWAGVAYGILKMALDEAGVGAKTSSGYGRLLFAPPTGYERGRVKEFGLGQKQSYGHIISEMVGDELFVHRNDLRQDLDTLQADEIVHYRREQAPKGPQAKDVHIA